MAESPTRINTNDARNFIPTIEQRPRVDGESTEPTDNEGSSTTTPGIGNLGRNPVTGERRPRRKRGESDAAYIARTGFTPPAQRNERVQTEGTPSSPPLAQWTPENLTGMAIALAEGYKMVGIMLAHSRGGHWMFSNEECAQLGKASANVVKHMPVPVEQLGIGMDIAMLGVAVVGVATPRIQYDMAIAEDKKQREIATAIRQAEQAAGFAPPAGMNPTASPPPGVWVPQPPNETPPA